jgi:hypothetical protein
MKKIVEPYISIHFRNTDIKNKLKRFTNINTVFLATDNAKTINAMKKLLPKLKIIELSKPKLNVKNQHYASTNKEEYYNQIYATLRDLYFISS